MTNIKEYFKNKRICITGASGFVGRNLCNFLKSQDLNVIGTCFSKPSNDLIQCDLTKYEEVEKIVDGIDYVFMIATKTYGAGVVKENPCALVRENLYLNANTLEACYRKKVKKVLFISSSTVYQESNYLLAEEDLDLNKPTFSLYEGVGGVKRYSEQLCKFYSTLGLKVNIVRPTNIYGTLDHFDDKTAHFIPAVTRRIVERQNPLVIWGKGNVIKNLIYIDDFIRDVLKIFTQYDGIDPFNICSNEYYSVRQIVNTILDICNYNIEPIYDPAKPDAIPYRGLLRTKFDSIFGKEQYTTLYDGLSNVVSWISGELKK